MLQEKNDYAMVEQVEDTIYVVRPGHRLRVQTVPVGESMALQSDADACDINNILARYEKTGFLPPAKREGFYDDVSRLNRDLTELMSESVAAFAALDAAQAAAKNPPTTDQPPVTENKGPGQDAPLPAT